MYKSIIQEYLKEYSLRVNHQDGSIYSFEPLLLRGYEVIYKENKAEAPMSPVLDSFSHVKNYDKLTAEALQYITSHFESKKVNKLYMIYC